MRAGHDMRRVVQCGGSVCLCMCKCVYSSLRCPQQRKVRFTSFFFLAAIPFTGQPHPSSFRKMFHHHLTRVSILHPWCNTSTEDFRFLFPPGPPVWILSAEQERKGGDWGAERRGEGSLPLSHSLRVAVPVHSAPGEQLLLQQNQLQGEGREQMAKLEIACS